MWSLHGVAGILGLVVAGGTALEVTRRTIRRLVRFLRDLRELAKAIRDAGDGGRAMSDFAHLFLARVTRLENTVGLQSRRLDDIGDLVVEHEAQIARLHKGDPRV